MRYKRWRKKELKRLDKAIKHADRAILTPGRSRRKSARRAQAEVNRQQLIAARDRLEREVLVERGEEPVILP